MQLIISEYIFGSVENETNKEASKACKRRENVESASVVNVFEKFIVHVRLYTFCAHVQWWFQTTATVIHFTVIWVDIILPDASLTISTFNSTEFATSVPI